MCVEVRRDYAAESIEPERAARFASATLLKVLQPSDWQISSDVELVVAQYVKALRDLNTTGAAFVEVTVHSNHVEVVIGSDDPRWIEERVRLRPRRPFTVMFDCHLPSPRYRRAPKPTLWPGLDGPRVEATAQQWRDTWDALHAITQSIATAGDDLTATLESIAAGVVHGTSFGTAAVNLVQDDGDFRVVAVHGPPDAIEALLGVVEPAESWRVMIEEGSVWGSLRFIRHDDPLVSEPAMAVWKESDETPTDPDLWHPRNDLFAPLYSLDGSWFGVLSVDPHPGARNPGVADLERLEVFADHAAAAIDRARAASVGS